MGNDQSARRTVLTLARLSVAGLFGYALATKLIDPQQLLTPFEYGLGLSPRLSGFMFILTVLALCICIVLLLRYRCGLGLVLSAAFFIVGAGYSVYLSHHQYQGSCGCGVSIAKGSEHELMIHVYQNAACAALCLFLGFRARSPEKGFGDETKISSR